MNALDIIYNSLKKGSVYGHMLENVRFPVFWSVLWYDSIHRFFVWRHYGQSAEKATKKDLQWIITVIFETTPEKFLETYEKEGADNE